MKRISFFLTFALVLMLGTVAFGQCEYTISNVTNAFDADSLKAGSPHVIELTVSTLCSPANNSYNITNGFTIYTPDGADFGAVQGVMDASFSGDLGWSKKFVNHFEWDGTVFVPAAGGTAGPAFGDTVAVSFGGVAFDCLLGLPDNYTGVEGTISFTSQLADTGKHICIDSTFTPPGGVWKWASLCSQPDVYAEWYAAPKCWTLFKPLNEPPAFDNCVANLSFSHCVTATYDFNATDPTPSVDGGPDPITYSIVSGPGSIDAVTGMWSYNTPPQEDDIVLVVGATDLTGSGQTTECSVNVSFTNAGPSITCPGTVETVTAGDTKGQTVVTSDDCDALTVSVTDADGAVGAYSVVGNTVTWTPDPADAGVHTWVIEVTDGLATATCEMLWEVIIGAPYVVSIEKDEGPDGMGALQGHFTDVSVTLDGYLPGEGLGAFDLLIAYDQTALGFQEAVEGDIYAACGWEYFTYRFGPDGNCGNACPSGMTRVVGMAETNNGPYHPGCAPDFVPTPFPVDGVTLFDLRFLVSNDRTFECQYAPIRFFWMDCGDNVLSNAAGTEAYLSLNVYEYDNPVPITNGTIGFPTFQGAQDFCLTQAIESKQPERKVDFYNGGVDIICADSIDARGDINLNGLAYEIADAVMFTNYFIKGLGAFEYVEGSIAASDANADGIPLSVADLVYLIRVVVGDALPYPKVNPTVAKYTVENNVVNSEIELGAALIVLEGNASFENLTDLEMVTGIVDGNRHVLLYSTEANATATGALLSTDGAVLKLEGATYEGQPVNFDLVPGSFRVEQNYPNPFNPTTIITFQAPGVSEATVTIYNAIGQKVDQMTVQTSNGFGEVSWDASDMSSGIYFYKVVAGQYTATKKAILLK